MIPEDIWRGILSSNRSNTPHTGDINPDTARQALDAVKHGKLNPATKGILYNQQLRRYLHLRKQHENKPVKVEVVAGPSSGAALVPNNPTPSAMIYDGNDGGDDEDGWMEDENMSLQSFASPPSIPASIPSISSVATPTPLAPPPSNRYHIANDAISDTASQRSRRPATTGGRNRNDRKLGIRRRVRQKAKRGACNRQQRRRHRQNNMTDAMNAPLPDISAEDEQYLQQQEQQQAGPSHRPPPPPSIPVRRGVKRRPLLSMRPPPFYGGKRAKMNPPKRQRRHEFDGAPPKKIFRPSFWQ
jgi:hypothetical protein